MSCFIEFHDSTILALACEGSGIRISLEAYVHWWDEVNGKGTGWMQPVEIVLGNTVTNGLLEVPVDLEGGVVITEEATHNNLVPLPFFGCSGPATLRLDLGTGQILELNGIDLVIMATGEGRYVEDLPEAFRP